jgi:hypothetical protein
VNPWHVEEDKLTSFDLLNAKNSVPGGLRSFGNDSHFLTEKTIEEGRFPDVRPSQDGDKTGFEGRHRAKMSNAQVQVSKKIQRSKLSFLILNFDIDLTFEF